MTEDKIKNSRPKKFSHRNTNNRYAFKFFFFFWGGGGGSGQSGSTLHW